MTQEEKARRYDETLEQLKGLIEGIREDKRTIMEEDIIDIFYELKESEDEKVRRAILNYLTKMWGNSQDDVCGVNVEDAIAWLEKQKSVGEIVSRCKASWYNEGGWHDALEKQGNKKKYTFKSIPRLLEMVEPTERARAYCQKLIDTLAEEGYATDAKIVEECLKQMNGEKVALATMDDQKINKSEDEMIRKAIIEFFESEDDNTTYSLVSKKDILSWLEKQGDKYETIWKPTKEQINALTHFVRSVGESGYTSPYDNNTKLLYSLLTDLQVLEKQDKQKPYGQREECFNCQFNYAGHCKGYCELKRQDKSTLEQCKQEGDRITTNPDGTHFNLSQLERVAKAETPEESLGISSEEYNKIVNECIFGELKETGKESNSNDRLDPLIDEEIDLWIKENKDIHHDDNNIVGLMRDMAYYVATLTRNLYKQKSKWTKEDSLEAGALIDTIKHGLSISFELKDKFITWLKSLKERLEEQ